MSTKTKGRSGWHQATQETTSATYSNGIRCRIKALIVGAALCDLLPVKAADWIIRRLKLAAS